MRATVSSPVTLEGRGLHSGIATAVTVTPATAGVSLVHQGRRFALTPGEVSSTHRCTAIGPVSTMEHLLSAMAGLGLTDGTITCDTSELPGLDGSAKVFAEALLAAGITSWTGATPSAAAVHVTDGDAFIDIRPGSGNWCYTYDPGPGWPGQQTVPVQLPGGYLHTIAPARTIVKHDEIDAIRAAGLGQGLGLADVVIVGAHGYLGPVRFPDEPARHKLLDLIGDLSLAGIPAAALDVKAVRSGHRLNVVAAAKLYDLSRRLPRKLDGDA